ncbi:MAG: hypothetical protein JJ863_04715 [Deltaproteobacteria bacterium]|nr:hypothetical protein [Deltaproteobacteria bacterium]
MYENQSHPAQFELYADPMTGEAKIRPVQVRPQPRSPNPAGAAVDSELAVRVLRLSPLAYDRPEAEANPGLRD